MLPFYLSKDVQKIKLFKMPSLAEEINLLVFRRGSNLLRIFIRICLTLFVFVRSQTPDPHLKHVDLIWESIFPKLY